MIKIERKKRIIKKIIIRKRRIIKEGRNSIRMFYTNNIN